MEPENIHMMQCKTCGAKIAKSAKMCPICGAPTKKFYWWLVLIGIAAIALIALLFRERSTRPSLQLPAPTTPISIVSLPPNSPTAPIDMPMQRPSESSKPEIIEVEVSAKELAAAYGKNEVSADNTYKNKNASVTGVVGTVGKDIVDRVYVTLDTGTINEVQCYFASEDEIVKAAELEPGQVITIAGTIAGRSLYNIMLNEGRISSISTDSSANVNKYTGTYYNEEIGTCYIDIKFFGKNQLHIFSEDTADGYGELLDEYTDLPTSETLQFYGYNGPYSDVPLTITFYPEDGSLYFDGYWVDSLWFGSDISGWFYKAG